MTQRPPCATLFPYTTLFRSDGDTLGLTRASRGEEKVRDTCWVVLRKLRSVRVGSRPSRYRVPSDRKSTRLNSSHTVISYAVFCLKKKKKEFSTAWSRVGRRG